jgi:hypothetical protein
MRRKARLASAILAVAMLTGGFLVSPSTAQEETVLDVSLGFAYEEDFQADDGGWGTTEVPPPPTRPAPDNASWEHADIPTEPARLPPGDVWEWGEPTYGPDGAAGGTNVWGTVLDGDYGINDCAGLISPVIDLTNATSASIAYEHWRDLRDITTFAYGSGVLYATDDGGDTLARLQPANGYDKNMITTARECQDAAPSPTQAYTGISNGWVTDSVDLSAFVGKKIQILFGFAAGGSVNIRPGWYLDNVAFTIDGATTVDGFESSDGGFAPAPLHPPVGSLPPGGAASGSKAWATYPAGALSQIECSGIMSPPLDLTGAMTASASVKHWYELRELTTSAPQAAVVFATTDAGASLDLLEPVGGYPGQPITQSTTLSCLDGIPSGTIGISGTASDWEDLIFDLSDYVGAPNLQLVFGFRKDSVGDYSGWYIDDFATAVDGATSLEDFETGDGGFTVVGVQAPPHPRGWEWGEPTSGPGVDEGEMLWGTNLDGDYGHLECSWIESPPFQVGDVPNEVNQAAGVIEATLSWEHWFRSNSIYGSGVVQVGHDGEYQLLEPEGGYPGTIGSTSSTFEEVTQWQTDCFGLEWAPGDSLLRAYSGTVASTGGHNIGDPMTNHRADLSAYAGEEITIRYLFATGWRDANPTTYPGWYVDNVDVEVRAVVTGPSPEGLLSGGTDAPGWSSGGPNSEWEFGIAGSGPSGELAYGTNLNGPYSHGHCGYIETPAVSGSAIAADPTLSFEHWYGLSQSGSFAWYGGVVLVSADSGPWELVSSEDQLFTASTPTRGCVGDVRGGPDAPSGTPAYGGWQLEWQPSSADLSAYAEAEEVRVRFVMGGTSTTDIGCGETTPCEGWFIRNVVLGGKDVGPGTVGSLLPELP